MTYAAQRAGMPAFDKFLVPIVDALKEHNGFASREIVEQEAIEKVRKQYRIDSIRPAIDQELRMRVERSEELLMRAGVIVQLGINMLKLTSLALLLTREEVVALPKKIREINEHNEGVITPPIDEELGRSTAFPITPEARALPAIPLFDDIATAMKRELLEEKMTPLQIEERMIKHYARSEGYTAGSLDVLRSRTQSVRRVLESLSIISLESSGAYVVTRYGAHLSDKELQDLAFPALDILAWRQVRKIKNKFDSVAREHARAQVLGRFIKEAAWFAGAFIVTLIFPKFATKHSEKNKGDRK